MLGVSKALLIYSKVVPLEVSTSKHKGMEWLVEYRDTVLGGTSVIETLSKRLSISEYFTVRSEDNRYVYVRTSISVRPLHSLWKIDGLETFLYRPNATKPLLLYLYSLDQTPYTNFVLADFFANDRDPNLLIGLTAQEAILRGFVNWRATHLVADMKVSAQRKNNIKNWKKVLKKEELTDKRSIWLAGMSLYDLFKELRQLKEAYNVINMF